MASLTSNEKQILEKLFKMDSGYVLNFSDRTISEFFKDDIGIDFYNDNFNYGSGSKANRMRGFWSNADDKIVGISILRLIEYIENQILLGCLQESDYPQRIVNASRVIGEKLLGGKIESRNISLATFKDGNINIILQKEVFNHVQTFLESGHYFNAVEEAYKIVREKLSDITGSEKATDAFAEKNFENIFGHKPKNDVEKDFFEGVKFLHMAIQFLRNEKAHTPAHPLDKNLAIHYISLASLAYDLITRNNY